MRIRFESARRRLDFQRLSQLSTSVGAIISVWRVRLLFSVKRRNLDAADTVDGSRGKR